MLEQKESPNTKLVVKRERRNHTQFFSFLAHKDFGFAERINDKELVSKAGTPGFIPPEVFKLQPYSSKGDIFSLGVVFYTVGLSRKPGGLYA